MVIAPCRFDTPGSKSNRHCDADEPVGQNRVVSSDEQVLAEALEGMRQIWVEASGGSHGHLDALLDPGQRRDPVTTSYLVSGASGTLRDRYFTPLNGDRVAAADVTRVNADYLTLLDMATSAAARLSLPAARDL
jgi:hypothetical protein